MELIEIYKKVQKKIENIDFKALWSGFSPYDFALYDQEKVILKDKVIPVNNQFVGNTAIKYENAYLAIWQLTYDIDIDVLTSKIIHEMFHAYQNELGEKRFPDEFKSVIQYNQTLENLNIKYHEHKLMISLLESFNQTDFKKLTDYRSYRKHKFPYEYNYESKIEIVEGMAQFVELQTLNQLNDEKYNRLLNHLKKRIINPNLFFPIRIISYDIGTILVKIIKENSLNFDWSMKSTELLLDEYISKKEKKEVDLEISEEVEKAYTSEIKKVNEIVENTLNQQEPLLVGRFKIKAFNVYSAKYYDGYVISQHFIMTEEKGVQYGDFLFDYDGNYATKIFKLEGELLWS